MPRRTDAGALVAVGECEVNELENTLTGVGIEGMMVIDVRAHLPLVSLVLNLGCAVCRVADRLVDRGVPVDASSRNEE
jgi:hypothetical protein